MRGSLVSLFVIAWAAAAGVAEGREGACPQGAIGTCTPYRGGNLTAAELALLVQPACASGNRTTTTCAASPAGTCSRMERTDSEDSGVTQLVDVYEESGEWASDAALRCASGQLEGLSAPGSWRAVGDDPRTSQERHAECGEPAPDLLAMTAAEVACESDEIQFGIHCRPAETILLSFTAIAVACEADDIQFGFRP
jgi:hypothetical protein